jgi:hypothetical protein
MGARVGGAPNIKFGLLSTAILGRGPRNRYVDQVSGDVRPDQPGFSHRR